VESESGLLKGQGESSAQELVEAVDHDPGAAVAKGALALIAMPFTFTQDDLLNTKHFLEAAKDRGYELTLDNLQTLHNNRILLPLYRVSDTPVAGRRISVVPHGNLNERYEALQAAADGRLRDSADEGYSAAWPYRRPAGASERWWNGFLYSSWQLLELHLATTDLAWLRHRLLDKAMRAGVVQQRRKRALALAALAPRYLPGIVAKISFPPGVDRQGLERFRFESDVLGLLKAVDFDPALLKDEAENLLGNAHAHDPLSKWLPLIRHANYSAWSKLRGKPLHFLWLRIGAEVLLRAHEDLAASGQLAPLPDLSGAMFWSPLHDRLSRRGTHADSLEEVLSSFGLSPHPRVLLLVEGRSELKHLPLLLSEFGLDQPEQVRVQQLTGASRNPQLLARYAITPRIGRELGKGRQLAATPTALVIAVDPENRWTPEKLDTERKKIQEAIREEVALQGAQIRQEDLDFLVNVRIWDQEYEFANFTDDELLSAITRLASGPRATNVESPAWQEDTRRKLEEARRERKNLNSVIGPLRIKKPDLAEVMWPTLLAKSERELANDAPEAPVLKVVLEVRQLVAQLSSGSYFLPSSNDEESPAASDSAGSDGTGE
jgi:hypothetical protein